MVLIASCKKEDPFIPDSASDDDTLALYVNSWCIDDSSEGLSFIETPLGGDYSAAEAEEMLKGHLEKMSSSELDDVKDIFQKMQNSSVQFYVFPEGRAQAKGIYKNSTIGICDSSIIRADSSITIAVIAHEFEHYEQDWLGIFVLTDTQIPSHQALFNLIFESSAMQWQEEIFARLYFLDLFPDGNYDDGPVKEDYQKKFVGSVLKRISREDAFSENYVNLYLERRIFKLENDFLGLSFPDYKTSLSVFLQRMDKTTQHPALAGSALEKVLLQKYADYLEGGQELFGDKSEQILSLDSAYYQRQTVGKLSDCSQELFEGI